MKKYVILLGIKRNPHFQYHVDLICLVMPNVDKCHSRIKQCRNAHSHLFHPQYTLCAILVANTAFIFDFSGMYGQIQSYWIFHIFCKYHSNCRCNTHYFISYNKKRSGPHLNHGRSTAIEYTIFLGVWEWHSFSLSNLKREFIGF